MFFCWGIASSMIFTLLPVFIVDELGGNAKSFGLLEGSVIFLSFVAKLCAGFLMDMFKKKRPMLFTGAILTVLSKISLACSFSVLFVFIAKSIDRFAKGLRHAPADAVFAEVSTKKGFAYSLRYMMNISGSLTGSVITSYIVMCFGKNFRLIFFLACIPTLIALYILKHKVKYNEEKSKELKERHKWSIKDVRLMPKEYWNFLIIVTILMFNRFSEGFITLRAKEVLPESLSNFPIFMAIYEICVVAVAIPIGKLSDKYNKMLILLFGICILFIADIFGIFANNRATVISIYIFAGMHMGATQGVLASIVAKSAPQHLIGTAFAIFYAIDGIALFLSNYVAGISSNIAVSLGLQGSAGPFIIGALSSLTAIIYILRIMKKKIIMF